MTKEGSSGGGVVDGTSDLQVLVSLTTACGRRLSQKCASHQVGSSIQIPRGVLMGVNKGQRRRKRSTQ